MNRDLLKDVSPLLVSELSAAITAKKWREGWVVSPATQQSWRAKYHLKSAEQMMLSVAGAFQPPLLQTISNYIVPVVGLEKETGNLLLGTNLEFSGTSLNQTVHAEQFLFTRAFHRGTTISHFALTTPTPCGHCRQFILEFENGEDVKITNSTTSLTLKELLPHAFGPKNLGERGICPTNPRHHLQIKSGRLAPASDVALEAAGRSYAPYTKTPTGVAIELITGELIPGSSIENAAFNPSISAFQSALVNLIAAGGEYANIKSVFMIQAKGPADQAPLAKALLAELAPHASFQLISAE